MSFASYNVPIHKDGTLPVQLFGEKLNVKRLKEKKIPWLICYGTEDDLVEKETALAPLDFIDAEVTPFPKGHVAIATSWSSPDSACALHTRFGEGNYRGPVLFHMDLDDALSKVANEASKELKPTSTAPVQPKTRVKKARPIPKTPPDNDPDKDIGKVKNMVSAKKNPVQSAKSKKTATKSAVQKVDKPSASGSKPDLNSRKNKP